MTTPHTPAPLRSLLGGAAMGCADAIPGVSGGTIALILGFYEALLHHLAQWVGLLRRPLDAQQWRQASASLRFLIPLGIGIVLALLLATRLLVGTGIKPADLPQEVIADGAEAVTAHLAAHPPNGWLLRPDTAPMVFAFFFGLVLVSIRIPWQRRHSTQLLDWPLAALGATAAATVAVLPTASGDPHPGFLLLGGGLAICAMLLPGISGSLVLLVLGLYQPVTQALHAHEWGIVRLFLTGVLLGATVGIPLLRLVLERYHDRTMALLTGMMAGSLVALWPWKSHYVPKLMPLLGSMQLEWPSSALWLPVCCALAGAAVILLGERYGGQDSSA